MATLNSWIVEEAKLRLQSLYHPQRSGDELNLLPLKDVLEKRQTQRAQGNCNSRLNVLCKT